MISAYLWVNALLYLLFAVWCTLRPGQTSTFLGLTPVGSKGLSEFVAVYGGLEAGLGAFYLISALRPSLHNAALLMSVCLYGGLVLFRSIVFVRSNFSIGTAAFAYAFEIAMAVAALLLLLRGR
jgi:hypothetical protein